MRMGGANRRESDADAAHEWRGLNVSLAELVSDSATVQSTQLRALTLQRPHARDSLAALNQVSQPLIVSDIVALEMPYRS
ncbi:hypothetical protein LMG27177_06627 [Paraburkholderia fynbosensis]|uniref:Uncharacterized protein n=1 Tax=Paraburkholderia fynbosensis TaxID=1200993 RepID=A0A6J5GYT1_9BURK|nr:hypothetical protein LMG27177_06627 [Paraburkholderia fynbosensis]